MQTVHEFGYRSAREYLDELKALLMEKVLSGFDPRDIFFRIVEYNHFSMEIRQCLAIDFIFEEAGEDSYLIVYIDSIMFNAYPEDRVECRQRLGLSGSAALQLAKRIAQICRKFYKKDFPKTYLALQDASSLRYHIDPRSIHLSISIPFYVLKLLAEGKSWYNQHGFIAASIGPDYPIPDEGLEADQKARIEILRREPSSIDPSFNNAELAQLFLERLKTIPETGLDQEQIDFIRLVQDWTTQIKRSRFYSYTNHLSMEVVKPKRQVVKEVEQPLKRRKKEKKSA